MSSITSTWRNVPRELRSGLRSRINSEQEVDRITALEDCETYGIDYAFARMVILQEMIEEGKALMDRQTRGESQAERWRARGEAG
jgi:hypothetical protein